MIAADPSRRGWTVLYRPPQACPACGRGHWLVGRRSAECAFCGAALALAPTEPAPLGSPEQEWWQ